MTYWINTVSADHVQRGVAGGFTQANHGKPDMLRKMSRDDWVIFYSPKTAFENGEPLQAFTAIGRVIDDEPYQAQMSPKFHPWRRNDGVPALHGDTHPAAAEPAASSSPIRSGGATSSGSGCSASTRRTSTSSARR